MRKMKRLGNIYNPNYGTSFAGNVWSKYGLCPTLDTDGGGMRQPLIVVEREVNLNVQSIQTSYST